MNRLDKFDTMTLIELGDQWEKYNYLMDKEHHSIKLNLDRLSRTSCEEIKANIQRDIAKSMKKMESLNEVVDYIKDLMLQQGIFEEDLQVKNIYLFKEDVKKKKKKRNKKFNSPKEEMRFLENEFKKLQLIRARSPLDQAKYFDQKIEKIAERLLDLKKDL